MLLEHYVVAREGPPNTAMVRIMAIAVAVPLALGVLVLAGVLPGGIGQGTLWLALAAMVAVYFVGWRVPVRYVLTDTHLRVMSGLVNVRWVPFDQIQVICRTSRDDELIYSGFHALAGPAEPVIINPHRPRQFRVAFTPSEQFIKSLFWATSRTAFDPMPGQELAESEGQTGPRNS